MSTAKAIGQLIEPGDFAAFPVDSDDSPNGVEYIGRIQVLDVTSGTVLQVTTFGGVQKSFSPVAVGDIIEGPITSIDAAATTVDKVRVHWLSGT